MKKWRSSLRSDLKKMTPPLYHSQVATPRKNDLNYKLFNLSGLSLFNLVKFDNDMCTGDKRNGTCYTKEECESRDGKESGTCAEGFGVCCILEIKCGKSSSDNNTYLVEPNPTAGEGCSYEICPSASSICRIRYDFTVSSKYIDKVSRPLRLQGL